MRKSKENQAEKQPTRIAGIRCIDTRALSRIISWSIGSCEQQLMTLKSAMNILAEEIRASQKKAR
ncbi:MAG TPA: hypothetical protein PKK48_00415 [Phycisphaerae bacterium]|nr:hypothetical protein [Phycisphaerae bacterium]HPS52957.1 hypothetical protein [Phycisphaerae bacterium]